MCCFNRPVDHVWGTNIFVGASGGKQITIYSASMVGAVIEMVLPVRTRGAKEIEFVDLKAFPDLFLYFARAFDRPKSSLFAKVTQGLESVSVTYLPVH